MVLVSTDISRLAANSASGTPFAAVCVASAAMLSKYPSSESSIWFVSWGLPSVFLWSYLFWGAAPNSADPPNFFSSPSLAASARPFATYAALKVVFRYDQVFLSSGSFDHSRVSVSYLPG